MNLVNPYGLRVNLVNPLVNPYGLGVTRSYSSRDHCSIFSTGGKFRPDYGLLLELYTLTLVARSYALLLNYNTDLYTIH